MQNCIFCNNRFYCNRIIDFAQKPGQGQACEMDTNLPVAVLREYIREARTVCRRNYFEIKVLVENYQILNQFPVR